MKRRPFGLLLWTMSGWLTGVGCIQMGPDFKRPDLQFEQPERFQYRTGDAKAVVPEDRWWEIFGDPEMNRLVKKVLENNLDLQQAAGRILELQYQVIQTRADRFPTLGFQGGAQRQREPESTIAPGISIGGTVNQYSFSLPASYEMDLWGKYARAEEASRAQLLREEENRLTLSQSLVAEAITLYLQIQSLERQIQITLQSLKNYEDSVIFVERRYKRGLTSILDLRQARRTLNQAKGQIPQLRQELGAAQQALSVLLGEYPKTRGPYPQPEDYYKKLGPIPAGLPSELLLRRPDIRAAEAQLKALNEQIGVAKASRFPSISLTGSYGYASEDLFNLFQPGAVWSLAAGLAQPLFDAGRLKANQRAAEARYAQGVAAYNKAVLNAFRDVEKALLTRRKQVERRADVLTFLLEARATQRVAEARYVRGLVDYLTVLNAQQTRFQAEDQLLQVELAILANRVTLHRALGGGWAMLPPVKGEDTEGIGAYTVW
ncbi:MAG: outer membrane protein multidrug efflux system [Thermodesulfobacteriota bacterium]|nr:outer membrane protein multidrug efflux system [Thermodesulfobacteriota bacterium]